MRSNTSNGLLFSLFAAVCAVCVCAAPAAADLYIQGYQPNLHDRLYSGGDKAFIGQGYDFSGVGRAGGEWLTMISPQYFLSSAAHVPTGSAVFYDNAGAGHSYTVDGTFSFSPLLSGSATMIYLGRLTAPIAAGDGIANYPILQLADSEYVGLTAYMYGLTNRVGRNTVDRVVREDLVGNTPSLELDFTTPGLGADEAYIMAGDAGAPSFVLAGTELALLGLHLYNYGSVFEGAASGDMLLGDFTTQLSANMPGSSVRVVPEPGTILLLATGGLALLRRRKTA